MVDEQITVLHLRPEKPADPPRQQDPKRHLRLHLRPSREHSVCKAVRLYNRYPGRGFGDQNLHLRRQQLGGPADQVQRQGHHLRRPWQHDQLQRRQLHLDGPGAKELRKICLENQVDYRQL